jgi:CRP-like cAMP-binding protein
MAVICLGMCFGWLEVRAKEGTYSYMLTMRLLLFVGHLLVLIWGATESIDYYVVWNIAFCVIHLGHAINIWMRTKPILLGRAVQSVWDNMFGPKGYNLPLTEFYELVKERAVVMTVHAGEDYPGLQLDEDPDYLSILVSGELEVMRNRDWSPLDQLGKPVLKQNDSLEPQAVANVLPFEFIDSYEYFARGRDNTKSQVIVRASKESAILRWSYSSLDDIYRENPRIESCIQAMLGQDLIKKFMRLAGRQYAGYDASADMIRKLDNPISCYRKAGIKDPSENAKPVVSTEPAEAKTFGEIVTSLRYANARMLAIKCTPLESLNPVPFGSHGEVVNSSVHMKNLVKFLINTVEIDTDDANQIIKMGKLRQIRTRYTDFLRAGERPYYLGIVLKGRIDVLLEQGSDHKFHSAITENELIGAADFQTKAHKAHFTHKVRSEEGATLFVWESDLLRRLMLQDPRLNTVIHKLLRDDHSVKLLDNQPAGIRFCGTAGVPAPNNSTRFC